MPEIPAFTGNSVFLKDNNPVMQAGAIAEKLRSGNFGPFPNSTAPPNFVLPPTITPQAMASALRSSILPNIGGNKPPGPAAPAAPAAPDPFTEMQKLALLQQQAFGVGGNDVGGLGQAGQAGHNGQGYGDGYSGLGWGDTW